MSARGLAAVALIAATTTPAAAAVMHDVARVNGSVADRFTWTDSAGLTRTVSIKQEGQGNSGHGGYAVQMTYQYLKAGAVRTVTVNPVGRGEGFGYFVSHEGYRDFADGDNDTIAHKIFGKDDSPLGLNFAGTGQVLYPPDPAYGGIRVSTIYHHYGTVDAVAVNADGTDAQPLPTNAGAFSNYSLPVTITWSFQDGTDYPRIRTSVDMSQVGPDRVSFDVRGPYGVMDFKPAAQNIDTVMWGDRFHFISTAQPVVRNSGWTWDEPNDGARYLALVSGRWEMGLFEPQPFKHSQLADGWSGARGLTSDSYRRGKGCAGENQLLPCDWEWPYQSVQYSLPEDPTTPTNYPKMAWGSAAFYGAGPELSQVSDTSKTSEQFDGHPQALTYEICLVIGRATGKGLTRTAARKPAAYNCAGSAG